MRILYIDPISPLGHINFNKLQIENLLRNGFTIDYIFKKGYSALLGVPDDNVVVSLPSYTKSGGIKNRYNIFRNLLLIKKWLRNNKYDAIIFSSFDEIALFLANFKEFVFLINHNNCFGLTQSKFKRLVYKNISKKACQLVMDNDSLELMRQLKIPYFKRINHGLIKPYDYVKLPEKFGDIGNVVFSPSSGSSDNDLFIELSKDDSFTDFLTNHNITILVKGKDHQSTNQRIKFISDRLTDHEYRALILNSMFIVINYPSTFRFRTSGVLLECIANNKKVLASKSPGIIQYQSILGEKSFYSSRTDFKNKFFDIVHQHNKSAEYAETYPSDIISQLKPDYSFIKKNEYRITDI